MSNAQRQLFPELIRAEEDISDVMEITCAAELVWSDTVEAGDDGQERKVPTFEINAYNGGKMRPAGFKRDVVVDLEGLEISGSQPVLRNHDYDRIVGHGQARIEGGAAIKLSGKVSVDNEHSREVVASSQNDFPWQASIGAKAHRYEFVREGESVTVNGQQFVGPLLVARSATLNEISFVPIGADRSTSATVAATSATSKKGKTTMDPKFVEWLEAKGFTAAELTDDQVSNMEAMYQAEIKAAGGDKNVPHTSRFKQTLEEQRIERDRVEAINRLGADAIKAYPEQMDEIADLVEGAQQDKQVQPKDFELELLRATKPIGPVNVHSTRAKKDLNDKVIEAAICKTIRIKDLEKHFDDETLSAADTHYKYGIGLQQLLFRAAAINGQHFDSNSNPRALLEAAFGHTPTHLRASGFSTFSLSGILSNTMNKSLADYFNAVESTWRDISAIGSVRDFKTHTQYSLTGDLKYEKLGPTGEIKHGTVSEETYTNKADTYARMMAITRHDIINDDLGALQRIPQRMGRGAALQINEVFWTAFLNNSSFFTSGRGNYTDGASTALDIDALTAVETLFLNLTDPDGNPTGVMPSLLLTPNSLSATAAAIYNSTEIRKAGTANSTYGVSNPHAGKFRPVRSSYLSNSGITGYSTKAWYLLADPMDMPVIEVVFLNGRDMPIVEQAEADFNTLGIQIRGYHDFGVTLQEYRGGVKSKGEA